jgi:hypothetical protein
VERTGAVDVLGVVNNLNKNGNQSKNPLNDLPKVRIIINKIAKIGTTIAAVSSDLVIFFFIYLL